MVLRTDAEDTGNQQHITAPLQSAHDDTPNTEVHKLHQEVHCTSCIYGLSQANKDDNADIKAEWSTC